MGLIANVEYFYNKCNEVLGTNYTSSDWGEENTNKPINIEWLSLIVPQVYKKIHGPKVGCRLHLSTRFNRSTVKLAVPIEIVNSVVNYLINFNKPCDIDCACARDRNCNCVCTTCNNCNCNCNCASNDCGSNTECQCDCDPYDCNCDMVTNCPSIPARPKTANCPCQCPCPCYCIYDTSPPTCDPGGGTTTCPQTRTCTYSWSGGGPCASGQTGYISVGGSITTSTNVSPPSGVCVTIPVSVLSNTLVVSGIPASVCSISPSSVTFRYNNGVVQYQTVNISHTWNGQSRSGSIGAFPQRGSI